MRTLKFIPLVAVTVLMTLQGLWAQEARDYAEYVTIVRDTYGVPHIYGETDPDVAYGLAWANAEDDFATMQEMLLGVKGKMGLVQGKSGAEIDFFCQSIGTHPIVDSLFDEQLSPEFIDYLNGYVAGVNDYAEAHPKEVLVKKAFPISVHDLMKGYFVAGAFVSGAHEPLGDILEGKFDKLQEAKGSNAFAFNNLKTKEGNTLLCVNPHMPFEGSFSWYEAHLVSEEGMNIMGALFHGGFSIYLGTNEHLGWSHTWNGIDVTDVYRLEMHPNKKLTYKVDGEWKKLEKHAAKLRVKLKKWLPRIPVRKKYYTSIYGPTFKSKNGDFYAIRFPSNMDLRAPEQWWRMGKAENFSEFKAALEMNSMPRFNVIYADKEGNIHYVDNGKIPKRKEGYNWAGVVPGNTTETLWNEYYDISELPTNTNPDCGYVFNTNNTPYDATCEIDRVPYFSYPDHIGFRPDNNNRSERFMDLMDEYLLVGFDDMKRIKFDSQYPDTSHFLASIQPLFNIKAQAYPKLEDLILSIQQWDRVARPNSTGAAALLVTFDYIFKKKGYDDNNFRTGIDISAAEVVEALEHTRKHFMEHWGTTDVTLGELQRLRRGEVDLPLPGYPDVLAANYSKAGDDGRYEAFVGDSYTMLVEYDRTGPIRIETLMPFGNSHKPDSPHYTDQMELFSKQQPKPMTMDRKTIWENAESIYKPGEKEEK